MAKRIKNTKVGDVFVVSIDNESKQYFQYIISDLTQLNSDVIRVFKKVYPIKFEPNLIEIVNDEIDFYTHCSTKAGIKLGLWEFIGNSLDVGDTDSIIFRDTLDYGRVKEATSNNWRVWKINKEIVEVGPLSGDNRNSHIGLVFPPSRILERLKTGRYSGYPDYE
jgi:hypothetical protein